MVETIRNPVTERYLLDFIHQFGFKKSDSQLMPPPPRLLTDPPQPPTRQNNDSESASKRRRTSWSVSVNQTLVVVYLVLALKLLMRLCCQECGCELFVLMVCDSECPVGRLWLCYVILCKSVCVVVTVLKLNGAIQLITLRQPSIQMYTFPGSYNSWFISMLEYFFSQYIINIGVKSTSPTRASTVIYIYTQIHTY